MSRGEHVKLQVEDLLRQFPYRPFVLTFENGERVVIEHPENIATSPDEEAIDFYVRTGQVRLYSTFAAITFIGVAD